MATIYELQQRADALRKKTETDSINPEEVGGLHADTLSFMAELVQNKSALGIRKAYVSRAAMEADVSPEGTDGLPLRFGQLVIIYDASDRNAADNGLTFAWQAPGWLEIGRLYPNELTDGVLEKLRGEPSAVTDNVRNPYTYLGSFKTWTEVQAELDKLHNTGGENGTGESDETKIGEFRALLDGRNLLVRNWVQNWATGVFTQTVEGSIKWNGETMEQSLQTNAYERIYNGGSGWGIWQTASSSGGNMILAWKTDAATTRKQVTQDERKAGMMISYKNASGEWINEQYVGTSFDDTSWAADANWQKIGDDVEIADEFGTGDGSENKAISQRAVSEEVDTIKTDMSEKHLFAYNSLSKIALSINAKFRRENYVIAYYNTDTSLYELYEYTRSETADVFWGNAGYWKQISQNSIAILNSVYEELFSYQSYARNNLARTQEDEAYNLLDVSESYGIGINTNGVIIRPDENQTITGADHKVSAPIYVSSLNNVTIYSADINLTNPPTIYKYDSAGKFLGYIETTTLPYVLDTSDCDYIRVRQWRKINLQVVAGTEVQPPSSPLWAFRSLYSEDVILPTKLLYLDQFVLPYYVESLTVNNNVEVYGALGLGIVNRKELFMPKSEGVFNITLGYGHRGMTNMQVSIKKARLSSANNNPTILCLGDSFTEMGAWQITLKENLESLDITPTFIGAMHSVNTILSKVGISENQTGGKLRANFMQAVTGKCYIVNVTGVVAKEMPINFNRYVTYDCNGYRWTVWGYQLDGQGDGKIRLYCTDSSATLPASGVLQKARGTGDSSINYNGIVEVNKNPFYNISTQKLDFNGYMSTWGYEDPHVVCLLFGENDMLTSAFDRTYWQDVQEFIETWHEQIPTTKFVVGCSKLYRRYANNWGESNKRSICFNMKKLDIIYKDSDYVYICPTWANVDPVDAFDNVEVVASSRFPDKKFIRQSDVHPVTAGMQQIGDAMTPYVVDALSE